LDALGQFGNSFNKQPATSPIQSRWSRFIASWKLATSPNVSWWVPYWSHTPRIWRECRQVFAPRSVLRVTIVSLLVSAGIIAWVQATVPGVLLPPLWKMLLSIPVMYAYVAFRLLLLLVIPTQIKVRKDRIHTSTGESGWFVKAKDVSRTRIVVFAVDRIRLHIFYNRNNRRRSRTFGVSPRINLHALCANLPVNPQVWDARNRRGFDHASRRSGTSASRGNTR
jgi:hypothetical protein